MTSLLIFYIVPIFAAEDLYIRVSTIIKASKGNNIQRLIDESFEKKVTQRIVFQEKLPKWNYRKRSVNAVL